MTPEHTPGPWTVRPEIGRAHQRYIGNRAPDALLVAEVIDTLDDGQCDANARLIAAAPDLLEALEYCLQHGSLPLSVRYVITTAIAKATGRAP